MLPVTSAGIIFQHGIAIGKFQGVMIPATPIGWRMLIAHLSGSSEGTVSPNRRRPSPAIRNAMSMPSWTSPRASASTLPISRVIARASRSLCSAISAPKRYRISPRFGAGVARQSASAISAAGRPSPRPPACPAWKRPTTSRVSAGLRLSKVSPVRPTRPSAGDEQPEGGRLGGASVSGGSSSVRAPAVAAARAAA